MTKYKSIYEQLGEAEEKLDAMEDEVARLRSELAQARKDIEREHETAVSLAKDNALHCKDIERKDKALTESLQWLDDNMTEWPGNLSFHELCKTIRAALSPLPDEKDA